MSAHVINWPTTDSGWCEWFKRLDKEYDEPKNSPLHHDNRCPIHTHGRSERVF